MNEARTKPAATPLSPAPAQPPEQLRYASVLNWGARVGLAVLLASFAAYVLGWSEPHVPHARLPEVWQYPVGRYLELTGMPKGWGWLALLHRGDVAALTGIVILAGCSLPALLALVPMFLRRRNQTFVVLCLAEAAVIVLAASGWLAGGH